MLTPYQYDQKVRSNALHVRALLHEAFDGQCPAGYRLLQGSEGEQGNALMTVQPLHEQEGDVVWRFFHAMQHRVQGVSQEARIQVSLETLHASASIYRDKEWQALPERDICVHVFGDDHSAAVRLMVSKVLTEEPFLHLVWRVSPHDKLKLELFAGERKLQSIWKGPSGSRLWGTCVGNSHGTRRAAEKEAEDAARFMVSCEQQERLSLL